MTGRHSPKTYMRKAETALSSARRHLQDNAAQKIANAVARIESGVIAPVELVCRAG